MGGQIAQMLALTRPDLVSRLVIAGSGPGTVPDLPASPAKVWQIAGRGANSDEDFLYVFFPEKEQGHRTGLASLRRLDLRLATSHAVVRPDSVAAQMAAPGKWRTGQDTAWERLEELTMPTLVANGSHDVMIPALASYAKALRLPNAKLVLDSDAGHGFFFSTPRTSPPKSSTSQTMMRRVATTAGRAARPLGVRRHRPRRPVESSAMSDVGEWSVTEGTETISADAPIAVCVPRLASAEWTAKRRKQAPPSRCHHLSRGRRIFGPVDLLSRRLDCQLRCLPRLGVELPDGGSHAAPMVFAQRE